MCQLVQTLLATEHRFKDCLDRLRLRSSVGHLGKGAIIYQGVELLGCPANIFLGENIRIYHRCVLMVGPHGRIELRDQSHLGVNCYLNATEGKIIIGKGVAIAPLTQIYSYSNSFEPANRVIECHMVRDVIIEDDVLIGSAVTILPGVTIHKGAIVGAGAVLIRDVPPYTIVGGVPARKIGERPR